MAPSDPPLQGGFFNPKEGWTPNNGAYMSIPTGGRLPVPGPRPQSHSRPQSICNALRDCALLPAKDFALVVVLDNGDIQTFTSSTLSNYHDKIFSDGFRSTFSRFVRRSITEGAFASSVYKQEGSMYNSFEFDGGDDAEHNSASSSKSGRGFHRYSRSEDNEGEDSRITKRARRCYGSRTRDNTGDDTLTPVPIRKIRILEIGNSAQVKEFYQTRFKEMQQAACKTIGKAFIKLVEPKKQTHHPYTKGNDSAPSWWPTQKEDRDHYVRHKEPDHLYKRERIALLVHILQMIVLPPEKQHPSIQKCGLTVQKLEDATTEAMSTWFGDDNHPENENKRTHLKEIFKVARMEERFLNGEVDGTTNVFVTFVDRSKSEDKGLAFDTPPEMANDIVWERASASSSSKSGLQTNSPRVMPRDEDPLKRVGTDITCFRSHSAALPLADERSGSIGSWPFLESGAGLITPLAGLSMVTYERQKRVLDVCPVELDPSFQTGPPPKSTALDIKARSGGAEFIKEEKESGWRSHRRTPPSERSVEVPFGEREHLNTFKLDVSGDLKISYTQPDSTKRARSEDENTPIVGSATLAPNLTTVGIAAPGFGQRLPGDIQSDSEDCSESSYGESSSATQELQGEGRTFDWMNYLSKSQSKTKEFFDFTVEQFKSTLVAQLMAEFWKKTAAATSTKAADEGGEACGPSSTAEGLINFSNNASGGKRAREATGDGNKLPEDEDGQQWKKPRIVSTPTSSPGEAIHFACPFRKRNSRKYNVHQWSTCALTPQKGVSRVKQHLYKYHTIHRCARCKIVFDLESELEAHTLQPEGRCELVTLSPTDPMEGITSKLRDQIRCRKKDYPGQTETARWERIYEIIFPGEIIPSPYFEPIQDDAEEVPSSENQGLATYEEYFRQELPRLFRSSLEGLVDAEVGNVEMRLRDQLEILLGGARTHVRQNYTLLSNSQAHSQSDLSCTSFPIVGLMSAGQGHASSNQLEQIFEEFIYRPQEDSRFNMIVTQEERALIYSLRGMATSATIDLSKGNDINCIIPSPMAYSEAQLVPLEVDRQSNLRQLHQSSSNSNSTENGSEPNFDLRSQPEAYADLDLRLNDPGALELDMGGDKDGLQALNALEISHYLTEPTVADLRDPWALNTYEEL